MKHSYKYFSNKDCSFYPCHKDILDLNCLFCFCPLYSFSKCIGNPKWKNNIKDCSDCIEPHKLNNYEKIISILSQNK